MTAAEFTALVQQYQGLVYTVCRQMVRDPDVAEDLAQDTFLSAWRSIDRCPAGFEKQWLARIAANKARDHLKSAWNRRVEAPGDEILSLSGAPPDAQPEALALERDGTARLTELILALREPYLTPAKLYFLQEHTVDETARLCGRPPKTVSAQLFRAKKCCSSRYRKGAYRMELFNEKGYLTDEGLQALADGTLDELGRLEAAEHLSYCDACMDRYTALLTEDVIEQPAHPLAAPVSRILWVQMMQSTLGRSAIAAVAAMLALTFWAAGVFQLPKALEQKKQQDSAASQTQQANPLEQAWDACSDFWTGNMSFDFFHNNGGK